MTNTLHPNTESREAAAAPPLPPLSMPQMVLNTYIPLLLFTFPITVLLFPLWVCGMAALASAVMLGLFLDKRRIRLNRETGTDCVYRVYINGEVPSHLLPRREFERIRLGVLSSSETWTRQTENLLHFWWRLLLTLLPALLMVPPAAVFWALVYGLYAHPDATGTILEHLARIQTWPNILHVALDSLGVVWALVYAGCLMTGSCGYHNVIEDAWSNQILDSLDAKVPENEKFRIQVEMKHRIVSFRGIRERHEPESPVSGKGAAHTLKGAAA